MRRVYLDQNKWIDLARAAHGRRKGERYVDALAACRLAVTSGTATFPLDTNRWNETGKRQDDASRRRLASIMIELSQRNTMRRADLVTTHELDSILHELCGRPAEVEPLQVHGVGLAHMMGGAVTLPKMRVPEGVQLDDLQLGTVEANFEALVEAELFTGGPVADETPEIKALRKSLADVNQEYAAHEESIAEQLLLNGFTKGNRLNDALAYADLGAILGRLTERIVAAGLDPGDFFRTHLSPDPSHFISRLPSRHVAAVMRKAKHAQGQQRWTHTDFTDLLGLPVAVVHCDVVVTEKQWVHHFSQAGVAERYDTVLLSDTAELATKLAG